MKEVQLSNYSHMSKNMEQDQTEKQDPNEGVDNHDEKWVHDSSLDYKGRIPLRASTGQWKASLLLIGIEFTEQMAHFSVGTNMIIYLTTVMHQDLKTATNNSTYWFGATAVMPLVGGFLADAYVGRFYTVLAASVIYVLALLLLMMSQLVPSLKPCDSSICYEPRRIHKIVFYVSIYLIALGASGHGSAVQSFGADQFDDDHPKERKNRVSIFNWWNFGLAFGCLLGLTIITYIQDQVSPVAADILLTVLMATALLVFCMGRRFYRYRKPLGSPLTPMLQVLVAAIAKRNLPYPSTHEGLHEFCELDKTRGRLLARTNKLKFLDKAAILEGDSNQKRNPWQLATVTQVEELKLIINMLPIWLITFPIGVCESASNTLFVKQAASLDRKTIKFTIPSASMVALVSIGTIISTSIADKVLEPLLRELTKKERGITILQKVGIGMVFAIVAMVVAALVEKRRLTIVEQSRVNDSVSMSVFWLVAQFLIVGVGGGFSFGGLQEFFYDQGPDSMRSLGIAFYVSMFGASSFMCSFLITMVDRATDRAGSSWFGKDLNDSRVDYFYWILAGIFAGSLFVYGVIARQYSYKSTERTVAVVDTQYHRRPLIA